MPQQNRDPWLWQSVTAAKEVPRSEEVEKAVRDAHHRMVTTANTKKSGLPIPASPFRHKTITEPHSPALSYLANMLAGVVPNNNPVVAPRRFDDVTQTGGFDPTTGSIAVLSGLDPSSSYKTLLHELLHAAKGPWYPETAVRQTVNEPLARLKPKR